MKQVLFFIILNFFLFSGKTSAQTQEASRTSTATAADSARLAEDLLEIKRLERHIKLGKKNATEQKETMFKLVHRLLTNSLRTEIRQSETHKDKIPEAYQAAHQSRFELLNKALQSFDNFTFTAENLEEGEKKLKLMEQVLDGMKADFEMWKTIYGVNEIQAQEQQPRRDKPSGN